MTSEQTQKAGPGSRQIQVAGDYVVVEGLTEERAVAIAREQAQIAIAEYTKEAEGVARERIESFVEEIIRELTELGSLDVLADPAFQILLRKAELEAAVTPDRADYEMLAKLLGERAKEPSKPMHLAITRAVQVIEYLDQQALTGLTSIFYFTILPASPDPLEAMEALDNLAAKLVSGPLPTGNGWLSRLDVLDCIHYEPSIGSTRSWDMTLMQSMPGYISQGILPEDVEGISTRLLALGPSLPALIVPHVFLPNRWRVNTSKAERLIESMSGTFQASDDLEEFKKIIEDARVDQIDNDAIAAMIAHVETNLPNLQSARTWWGQVQGLVQLTPVGVAVSYSNARRFDSLEGLGPLSALITT
jgi:hypothetical protein